jgi:predicted neuraminidase
MARLAAGTSSWSTPLVAVDVPGRSLGQPVFLLHPAGDLWLFFDVIEEEGWTSARPYVQRSDDLGRSWSDPELLLDYPGLMFRSKPLLLDGRILVPVYDEVLWQSRFMISDDAGASWRLTEPLVTPLGNIHPSVVELSDGRLLAYLRTGGRGGQIWRAESPDGGQYWTKPSRTELPNPNSGLDLLRLASGSLLLAFNDHPRLRTPLSLATADEDEVWSRQRVIEDSDGEFSYPTLMQDGAGAIHLVYTYRRTHIQHASFDEAWLLDG